MRLNALIVKFSVFLFCLVLFGAAPVEAEVERVNDKDLPNVFIFTLFGVRGSESKLDPEHQYIQYLWKQMIMEGVFYFNLVEGNASKNIQFHMGPVQSINSGRNLSVLGNIEVPSLFQLLRKSYGWPQTKVWNIGYWFKKEFLYKSSEYGADTFPAMIDKDFRIEPDISAVLNDDEKDFLSRYALLREKKYYSWPTWDVAGQRQFDFLLKLVKAYKPKFVHFIIGDQDTAHSDTFGRYALSIKKTDENIFRFWQFIKDDPYYKDNTYLFVSPDHSRNIYYMHHNEGNYPEDSSVWLYVYGPGVKENKVIERPIQHVDIFATVVKIFGLDVSFGDGKVLEDAFAKTAELSSNRRSR